MRPREVHPWERAAATFVPDAEILAKVTYTQGKDKGISLYLPVYPVEGEEWRAGVPC